jgi:pimeloyl-ACP methyl ester carboxylesterase
MLTAVPAEVLVPIIATLRTYDATRALDGIDVPTMVLVGGRDRLTPPAAAKRIATEIHDATLKTIRGCGHMPMLELPDEFNALLRSFLRNPDALYGGKHLATPEAEAL